MGKFIIVELLLFFGPLILFFIYVRVFHKKRAIESLNLRILTSLLLVGLVGLAAGAVMLSVMDKDELRSTYIPASQQEKFKGNNNSN